MKACPQTRTALEKEKSHFTERILPGTNILVSICEVYSSSPRRQITGDQDETQQAKTQQSLDERVKCAVTMISNLKIHIDDYHRIQAVMSLKPKKSALSQPEEPSI